MSDGSHGKSNAKLIELNPGEHHAVEEGESWLISYADLMTLLVGFFVILLSFSSVDQEKFEEARKSVTQKFGGIYQKPFSEIVDQLRQSIDKTGLGDQFEIKANEAGVDISFLGTAFFGMGSADFKAEAKTLLDAILPTIKDHANEFDVTVEGHTDDVPLAAGGVYKNNWELSSVRACRVLDYIAQYGFAKENLTAVGYGETRPLAPNRDENGVSLTENQSQNRRVVIKMIKRSAETL